MIKRELKAVMARFGDRQEDLAAYLHVTRGTLSSKINGNTAFTQPEIEKIALRYELTAEDIQRIFFASTVKENLTAENFT